MQGQKINMDTPIPQPCLHNTRALPYFRVSPKISTKFKSSVNQFNLHLEKCDSAININLNEDNLEILRKSLNKIYEEVKNIQERHRKSYFQMNLKIKGKFSIVFISIVT